MPAIPRVAEVAAAEHEVRDGVRIIGAWVVAKPGVTAGRGAGEGDPRARRETLAAYKRPREVFFVAALPRTPNGKVARRLLASLGAVPALGRAS